MAGCHGRDRRLMALHAIEEVALVSGGIVQLHLDHIVAQLLGPRGLHHLAGLFIATVQGILQIRVGRIEAAAVHPHPAIGAHPLGAHLDVVMSVRDQHLHPVRIGGFGLVIRGGVPHIAARRELGADRPHLHRSGVVAVHSPVGDVAVVADPVEQLAAADVVVPAPVLVDSRLDIILHRRRADPHLVVELCRWRCDLGFRTGAGEIMVAAGQAHDHMVQLPDQAVAHVFRRHAVLRLAALPAAGLPDHVVFLHGVHDRPLLRDGARQRLLAIDVLAVARGFRGHQSVPVVRDRNHDRVDVLARHHLAIIVVGLAVRVAVTLVDRVHGGLEVILVQITGGHHLAVLLLHEGTGISRSLHAPAKHGHGDLAGRCVLPANRSGNDGGKTESGSSGSGGLLQKLAA